MGEALVVAIVGAESTGKTTLASDLATQLALAGTHRVAWVPELLRDWCTRAGRTPMAHEQAGIMKAQHERLCDAAARHEVVVCDTTALMTAVYSRIVFGDRSLEAEAAALHRRVNLTLLTALDLPWQSDPLRDGPHVREPVDAALRELMTAHAVAFSVIGGTGPMRLSRALGVVKPMLPAMPTPETGAARPRLFTPLLDETEHGPRRWACECCVPELERALRRRA